MKSKFLSCVPVIILAACSTFAYPVKLIFDTDIGNDVDDVLALGMLNVLQSRGACQLLAVTVTKCDEDAGPFVDAIDTFYGHTNIPIGCIRGAPEEPTKFLSLVETKDGDQWRYPHRLMRSSDAPDPLRVIRSVLSQAPDGSVELVQVGYFSNFAALLDSEADKDLVKQKVRLLSIMGGCFQTVDDNNHFCEFNVIKNVQAAQRLAHDWPTPIVWSGYEIGVAIPYPAVSIERDYAYAAHHPLKDAYVAYNPPPHERPTWDLTAALYAVFPDRGYFGLSTAGSVSIGPDGFTYFTPKSDGRDHFLKVDGVQASRAREAFVQLCSQLSK